MIIGTCWLILLSFYRPSKCFPQAPLLMESAVLSARALYLNGSLEAAQRRAQVSPPVCVYDVHKACAHSWYDTLGNVPPCVGHLGCRSLHTTILCTYQHVLCTTTNKHFTAQPTCAGGAAGQPRGAQHALAHLQVGHNLA